MGIIDKNIRKTATAEEQMPPDGRTPEEDPMAAEGETDPEGYDKFMVVVESILTDEKNGVMETISEAISSASDLPKILASTAYDMVAKVDESTGGIIADEDLAGAAAETLGRIAEIAEAAGKEITPRVIARATDIMIRRFMEENGDVEGLEMMNQQSADAVGDQLAGRAQDGPPVAQGGPEEELEDEQPLKV